MTDFYGKVARNSLRAASRVKPRCERGKERIGGEGKEKTK
jgi:hypothetical protein